MKISINIKYILISVSIMLAAISGCKKSFLETAPKDGIFDATVWSSYNNANLFLNGVYLGLPADFCMYTYMPFDSWTDNNTHTFADGWSITESVNNRTFNATNSPVARDEVFNWWGGSYAYIRKCNIILQNAASIPDATEEQKKQIIAQAKFFRAYFYSWLVNFFGGVPIIKVPLDRTSGGQLNYPRSTYEECVKFIQEDLVDAAADLPQRWTSSSDIGRITKGACYALKSEMELYAGKWQDCVASCKEVFSLGYSLAPDYEKMFIPEEEVNEEVILGVDYDGTTKFNQPEIFLGPRVDPPSGQATGWGGILPSQELVDCYEFTDGKPGNDPSHANNPYANRDKRFYATILYNGAEWRGAIISTDVNPNIGSTPSNYFDDNNSHQGTFTGYYFHKYIDPKITPGGAVKSGSNAILLRLGEVYLNFAEAENEANGPSNEIYEKINLLRKRAGLPDLLQGLTKDELRTRIRNERRVELAFEGKRYFDIIRWGIGPEVLNGTLHGMKIYQNKGKPVFERVPAYGSTRKFTAPRDNLFPIPSKAIDQNPALAGNQNPGW